MRLSHGSCSSRIKEWWPGSPVDYYSNYYYYQSSLTWVSLKKSWLHLIISSSCLFQNPDSWQNSLKGNGIHGEGFSLVDGGDGEKLPAAGGDSLVVRKRFIVAPEMLTPATQGCQWDSSSLYQWDITQDSTCRGVIKSPVPCLQRRWMGNLMCSTPEK